MSHDFELSRLAKQLDMPPSELAKLAGIAPGSLGVEQALTTIVSILAMAMEMDGDKRRAAIWFKQQPIPACGGRTAHDLVGEGKANAVLAYLEAVRLGAYA
jgi:hypothetical protein